MNASILISRTAVSWRLAFVHAAQMFHYLMRALLLSLASVGFGFAWLCCSSDHFRSSKSTTAWIIFPNSSPQFTPEHPCPVALEERDPRTIDSLIRNRGVRA